MMRCLTFGIHPLRIQIRQHGLIALLLQTLRRLLEHQTTTSSPPRLPPILILLRETHLPLRTLHHERRVAVLLLQLDTRTHFARRRTLQCGEGGSGGGAAAGRGWTGLDTFGEGEARPGEECGCQIGGVAGVALGRGGGRLWLRLLRAEERGVEGEDGHGGSCAEGLMGRRVSGVGVLALAIATADSVEVGYVVARPLRRRGGFCGVLGCESAADVV